MKTWTIIVEGIGGIVHKTNRDLYETWFDCLQHPKPFLLYPEGTPTHDDKATPEMSLNPHKIIAISHKMKISPQEIIKPTGFNHKFNQAN